MLKYAENAVCRALLGVGALCWAFVGSQHAAPPLRAALGQCGRSRASVQWDGGPARADQCLADQCRLEMLNKVERGGAMAQAATDPAALLLAFQLALAGVNGLFGALHTRAHRPRPRSLTRPPPCA